MILTRKLNIKMFSLAKCKIVSLSLSTALLSIYLTLPAIQNMTERSKENKFIYRLLDIKTGTGKMWLLILPPVYAFWLVAIGKKLLNNQNKSDRLYTIFSTISAVLFTSAFVIPPSLLELIIPNLDLANDQILIIIIPIYFLWFGTIGFLSSLTVNYERLSKPEKHYRLIDKFDYVKRFLTLFYWPFSIWTYQNKVNEYNNGVKRTETNSEIDKEMQDIIDKSFEEFNNRIIYEQLTSEIIEKTPDDQLLQTVFDNVETNFKDGESYTIDKIEKLSSGKQAVFAIWMLQAEVNNGGFNQFYYNSSGQFAIMAKEGLDLIGANKYADLVDNANNTYLKIKDELDSKDDGSIESFSESYEDNPLNEYDNGFYELEKVENLDTIQIKFIRENVEEFIK